MYCSGIPFTINTSLRLTAEALLRAVAIQIPDKNPMSGGEQRGDWFMSRCWDISDYQRLVFRSLASPTSTSIPAPRQPSTTNLDPNPEGDPETFNLDVGAEEPGMTDVLDALSVAQPKQGGRQARVPRVWYQSIAESLPHARPLMDQMRLPREEWLAIIKLALTMIVGVGPSPHTERFAGLPSELNNVAECILNAFVSADEGSLSWGSWEPVISRSLVCNPSP